MPQEVHVVAVPEQEAQFELQLAQLLAVSEYWPNPQVVEQVVPPTTRTPVVQVRQAVAEMQFPHGDEQLLQTGCKLLFTPPYFPLPQSLVHALERR